MERRKTNKSGTVRVPKGKRRKRIDDYNRYRMSLPELIRYTAEGAALGAAIVWLCYHSVYALPVVVPAAVFYLHLMREKLIEDRKKRLKYHFRDFLTSLHTSMSAGYSLENAIRQTVKDLERLYGPADELTVEIREITRQMEFGKQPEELFLDLGRRSDDEDIRNFSEVTAITKRTGGSMNKVMESAWRNLCGRIDTRKEIDTVIAARRYEQKIMSVMPAAIILYLRLTFTGLLEHLYGNAVGVLVMTGCIGLYLAAFLIGRRITDMTEI